MRKDRNCGAYASAPMNGPMMMPYPMMGPMPMGMPTPTQTSCSCSCDNNNGELLQIKQQLNSLENFIKNEMNSKKIVARVKKEPVFIPIMARISIPFNLESRDGKENKISKKEEKVKEHLEEMSEITRHLSYNDINLLKADMQGKAKKQEKEEQIEEQKERQE